MACFLGMLIQQPLTGANRCLDVKYWLWCYRSWWESFALYVLILKIYETGNLSIAVQALGCIPAGREGMHSRGGRVRAWRRGCVTEHTWWLCMESDGWRAPYWRARPSAEGTWSPWSCAWRSSFSSLSKIKTPSWPFLEWSLWCPRTRTLKHAACGYPGLERAENLELVLLFYGLAKQVKSRHGEHLPDVKLLSFIPVWSSFQKQLSVWIKHRFRAVSLWGSSLIWWSGHSKNKCSFKKKGKMR